MKVLRPASNYKKMLPEHFYLVTFKRSFGFCLTKYLPQRRRHHIQTKIDKTIQTSSHKNRRTT